MSHVHVEVDGRVLFDGDIPGWNAVPDIPTNPTPGNFSALPRTQRRAIRQAMSKAAHAAMDKALDKAFGTD